MRKSNLTFSSLRPNMPVNGIRHCVVDLTSVSGGFSVKAFVGVLSSLFFFVVDSLEAFNGDSGSGLLFRGRSLEKQLLEKNPN